ncbi:Protein Zgrf1 [Manis pentadactyla]|nr:Protein Zgrf1 [Manis pentadactyla]
MTLGGSSPGASPPLPCLALCHEMERVTLWRQEVTPGTLALGGRRGRTVSDLRFVGAARRSSRSRRLPRMVACVQQSHSSSQLS